MTGSYPYMAPENFLGKPYGLSADVFSFGVLLWEMIHCKFAVRYYQIGCYWFAVSYILLCAHDDIAACMHLILCSLMIYYLKTKKFYHLTKQDYKDVAINKNYRPFIDSSLPIMIQTVIKESWDPTPQKRPTFERIAVLLRNEYQDFAMDEATITRSRRMIDKSLRSIRFSRAKWMLRGSTDTVTQAIVPYVDPHLSVC